MANTYHNLIFTDHGWERMGKRHLGPDMVRLAIEQPDRKIGENKKDTTKFIKNIRGRMVHVVATALPDHKWLVISVWVRGEDDQLPLVWRLIVLPFTFLWWLVRLIWRQLFQQKVR
jgi:hypothetical protein